ncbi:hypothetical protein CENSYa_1781 [Cenarchaeum symbiosum A]|uniref:Uncharacterized protein n=1 Tax=Cenarchaeum symbiosum (strain A) TaxID=414004 RepID=A0RYH4_CENSY|nr:hypothetical protein CENSYa_1781 [Cenarchaeum symbiosum A]
MYGMAEIVQRDASGIVLSQVIHNQVLDDGEETILHAVFDTSEDPLERNRRVSTVCLVATTQPFDETSSASGLGSTNNNIVGLSHPDRGNGHACKADNSVEIASGTATIGPIVFPHSESNFEDDVPIKSVAVCDRRSSTQIGSVNDISCNNAGHVFAAFDVTGTRFAIGDTITITYTFDVSSPDT